MGWRARDLHSKKDASNRPLYAMDDEDHKGQEQKNQNASPSEPDPPAPAAPPPPYQEVPVEDIVSHVESLHNCNDPVFHTVRVHGRMMHYLWDFHSNLRIDVEYELDYALLVLCVACC